MGNLCANHETPTWQFEAVTNTPDATLPKQTLVTSELDTSDRDQLKNFMSVIFLELFDGVFNQNMTEDEIESAFDSVDTNKDGTWDESEIRSFLKRMEKPETRADQLITSMPSNRLRLSDVKAIISQACKSPRVSRAEKSFIMSVGLQSVLTRMSSLGFMADVAEAEFQQIFSRFDLDQNGLLSKSETQQAISHLGLDRKETSVLLENLPERKIDFHTFLEVAQPDLRVGIVIAELCHNKLSDDDLKRCFAAMDKNGKGFVEKNALQSACLLANVASVDQVGEVMATMDVQWMSLKEFCFAAQKGLRHQISKAFARRHEVHISGEIMCLPSAHPDGLEKYIYQLEKQHNVQNLIKYVISYEEHSKMWRAMSVACEDAMHVSRRPFPTTWRGSKGKDFCLIDVRGSYSVSRNGMVGMHATKQGAIAMAIQALTDEGGGPVAKRSSAESSIDLKKRHRSTRASLKLIRSRSAPASTA